MTSTRYNARTIRLAASALVLLPLLSACKKTVDDATLTTHVQSALIADAAVSGQAAQVAVLNGVVTLTGNVSDDTARSVLAQDAAKVSGVKEVVNDLTAAGIAVTPTVTLPSAPAAPRPVTPAERVAIRQHQSLPPPENAPAPPPQPAFRNVTIDAGRTVSIRITENLDSETTAPGTAFNGVVTREIDAEGMVAIPAGSAVSGTVVDAKDAGHYKGNSILSLQLNTIRRRGNSIQISTEPFVEEGKGRGRNTAEKIGGGAAIGAVLGGIFGGGKGAAIGAGAGAGGGAAVQGFTRGQQVRIPSETVIGFRLSSPLTVRSLEPAGEEAESGGPALQNR